MEKRYGFMLFLFVITCVAESLGKFYQPISDAQFYKYIENRHNVVIALYLPYANKQEEDGKVENTLEAFRRVSRLDRYRNANVAFIAVELDEIPELIDDMRLSIEEPTIMLFKKGKVIRVDGNIFKKTGYFDKVALEDLLEEYFGIDIDAALARKESIERIRQEERAKSEQESTRTISTRPVVVQQPETVEQVEYVSYPSTSYVSYPSYYPYRRGFGVYPYFGFGRRGFGFGGRRGFGRGFGGRRGGFGGGRRGGFGRRR